jgi:hypothetical protein
MFGRKSRRIAELEHELEWRACIQENQARTIKQQQKEINEYVPRRDEIQSLRAELETVKNAARSAKREQTEADLFFVSHKILAELIKGKTVVDVQPLVDQQRVLVRLHHPPSHDNQAAGAMALGQGSNPLSQLGIFGNGLPGGVLGHLGLGAHIEALQNV